MLYTREATGTVDEVTRRVEEAAAANQFGVLGIHNLKEKMAAKGIDFAPECRVLEVCEPATAKHVLEANMSISTALPCRISVYEDGGKVKVATLRPTLLLALFGDSKLEPLAQDVENAILQIIDTACA